VREVLHPDHHPPLSTPPDEVVQIIRDTLRMPVAAFGAVAHRLSAGDRDWVRMHSASSLPDRKATLRLVAIRASRNLSSAATGSNGPVSLSRWIGGATTMHVEP